MEGISRKRGVDRSPHYSGGEVAGSSGHWSIHSWLAGSQGDPGPWGEKGVPCGRVFACSVPAVLAEFHLESDAGAAAPLIFLPEVMKGKEFQRFQVRSHSWLISSQRLVYLVA